MMVTRGEREECIKERPTDLAGSRKHAHACTRSLSLTHTIFLAPFLPLLTAPRLTRPHSHTGARTLVRAHTHAETHWHTIACP